MLSNTEGKREEEMEFYNIYKQEGVGKQQRSEKDR